MILMGRLVRDPEISWTRSADSKKYAKYTLAVNRRFKKQGQPDADFIPCIAWGSAAEFAEKFMKKSGMFSVVGHLQISSWDDNEGKKRWDTTVVVEEHYFAESKAAAEGRNGAGKKSGSAPDGFYPIDESIEDDDLPF
ncbi:single-stranded DNA-binding protein [Anaerotignum sp.]|nr:single-stranded DNA-binding protein [Anaerotignum sp.]MDY3926849.1 single-stranded DNA-binding protein [Anaerotignum sp.]